jgi:alkaline phosphatase
MMMETGNTDGGGHMNRPETTVKGVVKVEWAARTAIDWSLSRNGDTLVVVMSDHETGSINALVSPSSGRVSLHYGATSHTSQPVPVYAFGPGAELFEGVYDQTDVAMRFARLLDL